MGENKKGRFQSHLDEVLKTIKLREVEERYDIYFSRFYGLYFAKLGKWLGMTPTHISLMSLLVGIVGGALLYFQDSIEITLVGGFLVTLAGVLDSSDGQLARMTGQSSELGRIIDGLIDNLVFISCYLGGALYFFPNYGWWIMALAVAAGYAHSFKAALYEFYKSEFLFLVGRAEAGYIPTDITAIKRSGDKFHHRIMHKLYLDYTKKQLFYTTRTKEDRKGMQALSAADANDFRNRYSKLNARLLFWWAWLCGSNTHRNALIIAALFGRFDLYLWSSLIWTIGVWPVSLYQRKVDKKLLAEFDAF
ncbi:MAG: hypothetical protein Tsb0034_10570 [Ekhidna sp.]